MCSKVSWSYTVYRSCTTVVPGATSASTDFLNVSRSRSPTRKWVYSVVQAISRYLSAFFRPGRGFFGPTRSGVSSMHNTLTRVIKARIRRSASRNTREVRASRPCTNPMLGCAPVRASSSCRQRWVGMWWTTIKYTAQACRTGPYSTLPVPAPSGRAAVWVVPQPHSTACWSYWVTVARTCGISICWKESTTPRSRAPARSAPHPQLPSGSRSFWSSGASDHDRFAPGAPGCFPLTRLGVERPLRFGGVLPGWSSVLGGIEEFPLFARQQVLQPRHLDRQLVIAALQLLVRRRQLRQLGLLLGEPGLLRQGMREQRLTRQIGQIGHEVIKTAPDASSKHRHRVSLTHSHTSTETHHALNSL